MHHKAKEWDESEGKVAANWGANDRGALVPLERPCDWCGQTVEKAFIHPECLEKERSLILDIFN